MPAWLPFMLWCALYLPDLALQVFTRGRSDSAPLAVLGPRPRQRVVGACPAAVACGVEPGLGRDEAMGGLQTELAKPDSLFAAHQLVLEVMSGSSDRKQALAMLDVSRKSLGDPPELLPYGVRLNRRAGEVEAANRYAARCAGSGDDRLKQVCQKEL